ncbi:hypothetical protein AWC38_SpisGene9534 [Stylophora pistillata]|uniref:Uncharacterized protein n=1 Tax=Stylophora pistillata TaxID=50429 RepID=A0A2B4SB82_STYPI|nr:hypothetical protein AWC38_SpisGene9534 [Stylophora pistillata]
MEAKMALNILFLLSILLIQGSYVEGLAHACTYNDTRPVCKAVKAKIMKKHARRICSAARSLSCDQMLQHDYPDFESQK